MNRKYNIVGLMSGSSLDGLDVAFCEFWKDQSSFWKGEIVESASFPFPENLGKLLKNLPAASAIELVETDVQFIDFQAECINSLLGKSGWAPQAISSHGHTVFHNPKAGYTCQIGNGGLLAGKLNLPVICDFRTMDVGYGGQGAPLVPGAEKFLFSSFDACLNLGGIANISFLNNDSFLGFDISPCNQLLNQIAGWRGLNFDEGGKMARNGKLIPELKNHLESLDFYQKTPPKSLGNEEVASIWKPLVDLWNLTPEDASFTVCDHIAGQIARATVSIQESGKMLATGGGAFNNFLMEKIQEKLGSQWKLAIPEKELISFKEAYCFAFLGLKRLLGENNCFAAVTGAFCDTCLGAVYNGQLFEPTA